MMWDSGYREGTVRIRIWSRTGQGAVVPWEVALGLRPEISGGGKLVVIWEALGMCAGPTCSVTYKQPGAGWGSLEAWSEGRPAYKILLDVIRNSQVALWQRISMSMQETQEMWVWSLGWENPPEEEMATPSSILAWKIQWTEEPVGLQSVGSQRVGHGWVAEHTDFINWGKDLGCYSQPVQWFRGEQQRLSSG